MANEPVTVEPERHHHCRHARGVAGGIPAEEFEAEGAHGSPARLGQPSVAREHPVQAFLTEHHEGLTEPEEKRSGWCVGKETIEVRLEQVGVSPAAYQAPR
jgi:hypothetical protein